MLRPFLTSESGAITVDWTVLAAAVVGLGVSSVAVVRSGTSALGADIGAALTDAGVRTLASHILRSVNFDDGDTTGWSSSRLSSSPALGTFLGPFAGSEGYFTYDFEVEAGTREVAMTFDLLVLDSWDGNGQHSDFPQGGRGDGVAFSINGTEVAFTTMTAWGHGVTPSGSMQIDGTTYSYTMTRSGTGQWWDYPGGLQNSGDSIWRVTLTAENPTPGAMRLGVRGTSNETIGNESIGIDNLSISARAL